MKLEEFLNIKEPTWIKTKTVNTANDIKYIYADKPKKHVGNQYEANFLAIAIIHHEKNGNAFIILKNNKTPDNIIGGKELADAKFATPPSKVIRKVIINELDKGSDNG